MHNGKNQVNHQQGEPLNHIPAANFTRGGRAGVEGRLGAWWRPVAKEGGDVNVNVNVIVNTLLLLECVHLVVTPGTVPVLRTCFLVHYSGISTIGMICLGARESFML